MKKILTALLFCNTVFAAGELVLGTLSTTIPAQGSIYTDDFDDLTISTAAGYEAVLSDLIQMGAEGTFQWGIQPGPNQFNLGIALGPTFNFGGRLRQAFFVSLKAGIIYSDNGATNDAVVSMVAELGKRFQLGQSFSFRPGIGVVFVPETSNALLQLTLLRASYFF